MKIAQSKQNRIMARILRVLVVRMSSGLAPEEQEKLRQMIQGFAMHLDGISMPEALTITERLFKRAVPRKRNGPRKSRRSRTTAAPTTVRMQKAAGKAVPNFVNL